MINNCKFKNKIIKSPKAERHSHAGLSCSFEAFKNICNTNIPPPPTKMLHLSEMNKYIKQNIIEHFFKEGIFEKIIKTALNQAIDDGVSIIEMSIDCGILELFDNKASLLADFLNSIIKEYYFKIDFRPELGINRAIPLNIIYNNVIDCINTAVFKSIDLYGIENAQAVKNFEDVYKEAKKQGLKLKAHAGEFCDAESIIEAVKTLNLDEVQHGITAYKSEKVIDFLVERNIRLNICPTSNVALSRVKNLKHHPIRILYDKGVRVTVNTDDVMIFGQSLSDEYYNLYKATLFSESEIIQIICDSIID